ncbi:MAG: helix-turn-helix domain-containing protein [Alkalibacterium sp.]|uniref:ArsR/SmtB family transcription factor n=1 Tax=Alkalibacterium sp. TaxID=1872447 RepID=UPI003970460F
MKTKHLAANKESLAVLKAVANKHRLDILRLLSVQPYNVNELADKLNLPFSTTATNVKKLEEVNLISTELVPGRGTQKVSAKNYDRILLDLFIHEEERFENQYVIDMPIGEYFDCYVQPNCGLVNYKSYIGIQDDPRSFYNIDRRNAQLLFMRHGFVEYRYQNQIPDGKKAEEIEVSAELCSEAPNHKEDWPSDITIWINDHEIGTWTSPSDFGGERGLLTPAWWNTNFSQYGMLKRWSATKFGIFLDDVKISSLSIEDLELEKHPFISVKIGVKDNAVNKGGFNLFGNRFGNYEQGIKLKVSI